MNKTILPAVMCLVLFAGCVSTSTGTPKPVADDGDAAEFNYQLGARYYQNGQYELARDRLLLSIDFDPKRAITHSTLALTYEAMGNERLARESFERAVRVEPRNFNVQDMYAVFLCEQKDFDGARKHFSKAAEHPENDNAEATLTNAGICMVGKPDLQSAETFFRQALDRKSQYPDALLQLCLLKFRQEDYLGARAFLQRFMSVSKTSASVLYLAVQIEGQLGNERGRNEYVNQLLRDFPQSEQAKRVLESG